MKETFLLRGTNPRNTVSVKPSLAQLADVRDKLGEAQLVPAALAFGRKEKLGYVYLGRPGWNAPQGFTVTFRPPLANGDLEMHAHRMGRRGRGQAYYAPTSALALLAYLLEQRPGDAEYQHALASAARFVGQASQQGTITASSRVQVAMRATENGWAAEAERARNVNASFVGNREDIPAGGVEESDVGSSAAEGDHGYLSGSWAEDAASLGEGGLLIDGNLDDIDLAELLGKKVVVGNLGGRVSLEYTTGIRPVARGIGDAGIGYSARLIALHDPIEATRDEFGPDPGHRYVGVELEIENQGQHEGGSFQVTLLGDDRKAYETALATRDPTFDDCPDLAPGDRAYGFLLFEVRKGVRPQRFVMAELASPAAVAWTFGVE